MDSLTDSVHGIAFHQGWIAPGVHLTNVQVNFKAPPLHQKLYKKKAVSFFFFFLIKLYLPENFIGHVTAKDFLFFSAEQLNIYPEKAIFHIACIDQEGSLIFILFEFQ